MFCFYIIQKINLSLSNFLKCVLFGRKKNGNFKVPFIEFSEIFLENESDFENAYLLNGPAGLFGWAYDTEITTTLVCYLFCLYKVQINFYNVLKRAF